MLRGRAAHVSDDHSPGQVGRRLTRKRLRSIALTTGTRWPIRRLHQANHHSTAHPVRARGIDRDRFGILRQEPEGPEHEPLGERNNGANSIVIFERFYDKRYPGHIDAGLAERDVLSEGA